MGCPSASAVETGRVLVHIPDLFKSFIKPDPAIRSDYAECKQESCKWLAERLGFDDKATRNLGSGDFTWFAACYIPETPFDRFRIVSDWTNLIFYYDDMFDFGDLKDDPERTKATIARLFAAIDGDVTPADPSDPDLDYVDRCQAAHDDFWCRYRALASPSHHRHYRRAMEKFLSGALKQVQDCAEDYDRSLDEILERRSDSVGMDPCYPMVCFAYDLDIPDEILESAAIQEMEQLTCELTGLQNDVVSYRKEECDNVTHNMIAVCRLNDMNVQEAYDVVGNMIDARLGRMHELIEGFAYLGWGEEVERQVAVYIEGIKNLISANVHWSFRSQRYFGLRNTDVRRTRLVDLLEDPPYLRTKQAREEQRPRL